MSEEESPEEFPVIPKIFFMKNIRHIFIFDDTT